MPAQTPTSDVSQHWRTTDATGSDDSHRIHGKWWVSIANIVAIDVCIWDKELNRGRVFYSRDLTAFVNDRRGVELPKHMIASDRLAEAEDAWDLLMAVIQAVADAPWKPLADGEVIPPQRCAPSEGELAKAVTSGWVEGVDEFGKYGPQFDPALPARAVLALFGDQPTVAQAKADALREAAMDWTDFDAAAMGTPAAWFRARAAAIEKGAQ